MVGERLTTRASTSNDLGIFARMFLVLPEMHRPAVANASLDCIAYFISDLYVSLDVKPSIHIGYIINAINLVPSGSNLEHLQLLLPAIQLC